MREGRVSCGNGARFLFRLTRLYPIKLCERPNNACARPNFLSIVKLAIFTNQNTTFCAVCHFPKLTPKVIICSTARKQANAAVFPLHTSIYEFFAQSSWSKAHMPNPKIASPDSCCHMQSYTSQVECLAADLTF